MEQHDVLDIPENDLFLVEDVNGNAAAWFQKIHLVAGESLHGLHKLLLSINQALNELTEGKDDSTVMQQ